MSRTPSLILFLLCTTILSVLISTTSGNPEDINVTRSKENVIQEESDIHLPQLYDTQSTPTGSQEPSTENLNNLKLPRNGFHLSNMIKQQGVVIYNGGYLYETLCANAGQDLNGHILRFKYTKKGRQKVRIVIEHYPPHGKSMQKITFKPGNNLSNDVKLANFQNVHTMYIKGVRIYGLIKIHQIDLVTPTEDIKSVDNFDTWPVKAPIRGDVPQNIPTMMAKHQPATSDLATELQAKDQESSFPATPVSVKEEWAMEYSCAHLHTPPARVIDLSKVIRSHIPRFQVPQYRGSKRKQSRRFTLLNLDSTLTDWINLFKQGSNEHLSLSQLQALYLIRYNTVN